MSDTETQILAERGTRAATAHAGDQRSAEARRLRAVLVTGAGGEMGHGLLEALFRRREAGGPAVIALDRNELAPEQRDRCEAAIRGDVRDAAALAPIAERFDVESVFHLAAILSSGGERDPELAHEVNVQGTHALLGFAAAEGRRRGGRTRFLYPSTIAVYGLPDLATKQQAPPVKEEQFLWPITMYGCNKLYGEHLGRYHARHYRMLGPEGPAPAIDFRCIRFPGIISAETLPTGGTSDFAPEMLHAAAQGTPARCFVRPASRIPFMTMPEAIEALLALEAAPAEALRGLVYNVASFAPSAGEFAEAIRRRFPGAAIEFAPHPQRQAIVDSWPARVDDSAARRDFGWQPRYDLDRALDEYLVPAVRARYGAD
ncbi:MAG TPA: NAD-dependent epimerase/dehydratase family protein [Phycisphaerales bacterium]|nr:NAD-dependent epimerase/dehydratase family protein [Phycisphaerales bacterium]HMP36693.1 NAD-dependent epimerase/dehydratase family protein [Phycisphaerales bacterium]